jgi:hypothetical protein
LASQIQLVLNRDGRVGLRVEAALSVEQPLLPEGSNASASINQGWPSYCFGDGTKGSGGILQNDRNEPEFRMFSKPGIDSINRVSFEIQDSLNEFRQDSISVVDNEDAQFRRTEVAQSLPVLGVPNFSQALRVCQTWLNKSLAGNVFLSLRTTMRGIHLRPGEIISVNYPRFGLDDALFRIIEIHLSSDLQKMQVTGQLHRDEWYSDNPLLRYNSSRIYSWGNRSVRSVCGASLADGQISFTVNERLALDPVGAEKVELTIPFTRPSVNVANNLNSPLVTFDYDVYSTGGALKQGSYFYAATAVDSVGRESQLSSLIQVKIISTTTTNRVLLKGIRASADAVSINLYRGSSPRSLVRVASTVSLTGSIIDSGLDVELALPPDEKYSHLQSFWRREVLGATFASIYSINSIGNSSLALIPGEWIGKKVSILRGVGSGQERLILSNTETALHVDQPWLVVPDLSSEFSIAEPNWQSGERSDSNEVKVYLPPWSGDTFQISLRSVGVDGIAIDAAESPLIHWRVGVGNSGGVDDGPPPLPLFGLSRQEGGLLRLGDIAFEQPRNLSSVYAGLLKVWFWNELLSPTEAFLSSPCGFSDSTISLGGLMVPLSSGGMLQIESELMEVVGPVDGGEAYEVVRGKFGTVAAPHSTNVVCFPLDQNATPIALLPGFLNSSAGASFVFTLSLPNVRVSCASLELYNRLGKSPVSELNFVASTDGGLRTLIGGQIVLSTQGYLSIEAAAGAALTVDRTLCVRDLFAIVEEAPTGGDISIAVRVNGDVYAELLIVAGQLSSVAANRFNWSPIPVGARLNFDVLSVPSAAVGSSGRDLSILIRT